MGLRIVDRRQKQTLGRITAMRRELLEEEAERFSSFKGGDAQKSRDEFLTKIRDIRCLLTTAVSAQEVAKRLEVQIKQDDKKSIQTQGPLVPSVILDLL